ncbi:MAG: tetratricopeptide repeat protein [Candidatus Omnitrophica bacterium]|nr:tetratricopeptide repeat protein [Candidatus Omnitrophota bacterium]
MEKEGVSLILEILRQENQLKMSVFEHRDIISTVRHYSQCTVATEEIDALCRDAYHFLDRIHGIGNKEPDLYGNFKKTAQLLWENLLTRPVKDRLRTSLLKDLVLLLDEELMYIPWECLYDGNDFLALKFNMGRLLRSAEPVPQVQYRSVTDKIRMLILANPTGDLKSAYLEGINIKNQFDKKRDLIKIDFKSQEIDALYVKKNLYDYDIIHYAGHCEYDAQDPKNTGWVLKDGRLSPADIGKMIRSNSMPFLIFSNACQSALHNRGSPVTTCREKNYSLAAAFLLGGVRHYIGSIRKVEDEAGFVFAKEFYAHLFRGEKVGECMRMSRLKLIHEHGVNDACWANYLLYGDPSFKMFGAKAHSSCAKISKKTPFYLSTRKLVRLFTIAVCTSAVSLVLYMQLPSVHPRSYFAFRQANQLFLKGKNQQSLTILKQLIREDSRFVQAYPLVADIYQRLGQNDQALQAYFAYAMESQKRKDGTHLADAYIKIGWLYHMQGEYARSLDYYHKGLSISKEFHDKLNEATALRKIAVWFIDKGNYNKALELLTKSSEINRERQNQAGHRYNLACDYFDLGLLFSDKEDMATAREFYNKSLKLFQSLKMKHELSDYYFNMGEMCVFDKQYSKALEYYQAGLKIDQAQNNIAGLASDYNMIGELYIELEKFEEAIANFEKGVELAKRIKAKPELALAYCNLGQAYKRKGQKNKAREYFRLAQEIYQIIDIDEYAKVKKELLELYEQSPSHTPFGHQLRKEQS